MSGRISQIVSLKSLEGSTDDMTAPLGTEVRVKCVETPSCLKTRTELERPYDHNLQNDSIRR